MWMTVHMIRGKNAAITVANLLNGEGILVKTKAVYKNVLEEENYYEIRVLESEAESAREVLVENGY